MGRVQEMDEEDIGRYAIGGNNPPDPTPFEAITVHIQDLTETAKGFLDGSGVTTQAEADAVAKLMDEGRKATKAADTARTEEKKPHDDAGKAVQAKWKPLVESGERIVALCKQALGPFLEAQEAEKRRIAEAARREAEIKLQAALEASRAAHATDLEAREQADALEKAAKAAVADANRAEKDKAHGKGGARAATLRTSYRPVLVDRQAACAHYYKIDPALFDELLMMLAKQDIQAGKRAIVGFDVVEERSVV